MEPRILPCSLTLGGGAIAILLTGYVTSTESGPRTVDIFLRTSFLDEARKDGGEDAEITFYDSNSGKPLFKAPRGRTFEEFVRESKVHGWPSFRDNEVVWDNMRVLSGGEAVSVDGTHLGHNLPDSKGNRYCINLVSVAGRPMKSSEEKPL
mmetsp:Transcript_49062/g.147771  ORF Transcript_49062/g.147771 Transcript_49062/m.147771 type:complete len:151 (+) Transcript_49062:199-651(+)